MAFARTVDEAAMFVRLFGDTARQDGVCDVGNRDWLAGEAHEVGRACGLQLEQSQADCWFLLSGRARAIWEWSM